MKRLLYIVSVAFSLLAAVSCQEKEDDSNPLIGTWQQVEYRNFGETHTPGEGDASFVVFEQSKMKRYSSESEKCELTLDIGYLIKDGFLWYDTGSSSFTNNEAVLLSGTNLTITQENGNYDKYTRVPKLPLNRE